MTPTSRAVLATGPARAAAVLLLAVSLLLAGCGILPTPDVTSTPITSGVPAALRPFYGQAIVWRSCGDGVRCATVAAPLDWADPAGARIRLALAMHAATGDRRGTLFTNPGGPGASGVDLVRNAARTIFDPALLEHYDIVSWDPRGVGASTAVDCYGTAGLDRFLFGDPDPPAGGAALQQAEVSSAKAFGRACARRSGALLDHVGTVDTVHDLDMLRAAAGERTLDYLGFSYGTYIGALYAEAHPTRVGRMVLDGAVDPSTSSFEENLANTRAFGAALKAYLRDCLAGADCPFRGEDVDGAIDAIARLLVDARESPIRTADGREVNSVVLRYAIQAALYDEAAWPDLSRGFAALRTGDPAAMQTLSDRYVGRTADGYAGNLFEAVYAVRCVDKPVTTDPAEIAVEDRLLDAADPLRAADDSDGVGNAVCANWPAPVEGTVARISAVGAPPILVLGNTGDPATPYAWARSVAGQLPGAVLLTLRGEGHLSYPLHVACVNDRVDAFLVDGAVPPPITCT